jgi:hypothetical protein
MRRRMVEMQKQIEDLLAYVRDHGTTPEGTSPQAGAGSRPGEALVRAAAGQLQPIDLF